MCRQCLCCPEVQCPEENWLSEIYLEAELQAQGFQVDSLKVSAGKCYEAQTKDSNGKHIVVYLNPETGDVIEKK